MPVIRTPGGRKKVSCHICENVVKTEIWAEQRRLLRAIKGEQKRRPRLKEKILKRLKSTRQVPTS